MTTQILLDTQTLAFKPDAAVLTISCVKFDFKNPVSFAELVKSGFAAKFNVKEQIDHFNRKVNKSTVDWWLEQPENIQMISIKPSKFDKSMKEGADRLREYIKNSGYDFKDSYVWAKGSHFDFPIIDHIYGQLKENSPYNNFKIRDTRTMIDVLTGSDNGEFVLDSMPKGYTEHNALHDAALEAYKLQYIFSNS